ncbi:MAG: hypothetical protein ACOY0R_18715 [Chloroflexota bacterium]
MKSLPILLILCGLALAACGRFEVSVVIPATATPTFTATPAPSPLPTRTFPSPTQTASPDPARATVTPFTPFPDVVCAQAWFFTFEYEHLSLAHACPGEVVLLDAVGQDFEGGRVIRLSHDPSRPEFPNGVVYVIYNDGEWDAFADEWLGGLPPSDSSILPPSDRTQPVESIGWVWREYSGVRRRLGWAYEPQSAFQGRYQKYLGREYPYSTFFDHGKLGLVLLLDAAPGGPHTWSVVGAY